MGAQAGLLAPLFVPSPRESCRVLLGLGGSWGQCPKAETLCPQAQSSLGSGPGRWAQEGSRPLLSDTGDACGGCGPGKDGGGQRIKQLGRVLCEFSQELGLPGPHVTPPVIVHTSGAELLVAVKRDRHTEGGLCGPPGSAERLAPERGARLWDPLLRVESRRCLQSGTSVGKPAVKTHRAPSGKLEPV